MTEALKLKMLRGAIYLAVAPFIIPLVAIPLVVVGLRLNQALEEAGICLTGKRIDTHDEALAFAKTVLDSRDYLEEAGYKSAQDYVAAIEAKPNCCFVSYGQRFFEDAGQGWSVSLDATHLKNAFQHEIEFNRCGGITYNGGLSLKGAN